MLKRKKATTVERYTLQALKHHALEFDRKQNEYKINQDKINKVSQKLQTLKKRRRFQDIHDIKVLEEKLKVPTENVI